MAYFSFNVKGLFEQYCDFKYSQINHHIGYPIEVTYNNDY